MKKKNLWPRTLAEASGWARWRRCGGGGGWATGERAREFWFDAFWSSFDQMGIARGELGWARGEPGECYGMARGKASGWLEEG